MNAIIRKIVTVVEETHLEMGKAISPPTRRAAAIAVIENPFAGRYVDRLTIVVCTLRREPIPGELRYRWMRDLFPFDHVVHPTDELPQALAEPPDFWPLWKGSPEGVRPGRL